MVDIRFFEFIGIYVLTLYKILNDAALCIKNVTLYIVRYNKTEFKL